MVSDFYKNPNVQEIITYYDDLYLHADIAYDEGIIDKYEYISLKKKCEEDIEKYRATDSVNIDNLNSDPKSFLFELCVSFIPVFGGALSTTIETDSSDTLDSSAISKITTSQNSSIIQAALLSTAKYQKIHTVYELYEEVNGEKTVKYVGRTKLPDIESRLKQHKRNDIEKRKLDTKVAIHEGKKLENLNYFEARGLEQIIIEKHGGLKPANGDKILLNKINGIKNGKKIYEDILSGKKVSGKGATYLKAAFDFLKKL